MSSNAKYVLDGALVVMILFWSERAGVVIGGTDNDQGRAPSPGKEALHS